MVKLKLEGKALKGLFNQRKDVGVVIPAITKYLNTVTFDNDRGHGLNSPSSVSICPRAAYYQRMGFQRDTNHNEPRLQRIFDNGTGVHIRLQDYLSKSGVLLLDELPVYNEEFQVMGHSDGLLRVGMGKCGILEIKSINSNGFNNLVTAKAEHIEQAQVYMYCTEELRLQLVEHGESFKKKHLDFMRKLMEEFVVDGNKYTKEEKIAFELERWSNLCDILLKTTKPIDTMYFLYENKDTQELKEFIVEWDEEVLKEIFNRYDYINESIEENIIPDRPMEATSRGCRNCTYCNYKIECWN